MTIAIWAGAAGVGKTALSDLTAQHFAQATQDKPTLLIDANPDQLSLEYAGIEEARRLGLEEIGGQDAMAFLVDTLEARNPFYEGKLDHIISTSPVTSNSGFWKVDADDPVMQQFSLEENGINFMQTGAFKAKDVGVSCSHDNIGSLIFAAQRLNDGVQGEDANVLIDYAHGEDGFGTPLYPQSDVIVLVTEPTAKSIGITKRYLEVGAEISEDIGYPIEIAVIGNRLSEDPEKRARQEERLRDAAGERYIGGLWEDAVLDRSEEIGAVKLDDLREENRMAIAALAQTIESVERIPEKKQAWLERVHAETAEWYDSKYGTGDEIATQYKRSGGTCGSGCSHPHHNHSHEH